MTYPFLKRCNKSVYVKLHKELYGREEIEKARAHEPDAVIAITSEKKYYCVRLNAAVDTDCFDFLNYLIYLRRNG